MTGPLVSIVIPIYNVEKYLEECFDAVVGQTYKNIEIIMVNDGSTDESGIIADTLAQNDARTVVIHKENGGLSDARNTGMRLAKGKYVTFIDSDDYVDIRFIEKLLESAEKMGADIVQCDNSRDADRLGGGAGRPVSLSGRDAFVELMKFKIVSPTAWGKLYRLSLFRDNNLEFPVGRLHEDTAILYKLVYFANKVVCLDKILYYYRVNNNSITTSSYTENHYGSVVRYHDELHDFMLSNMIYIEEAVICRHKAFRILSVLNKLALRNEEGMAIYVSFRRQYIHLAARSRSLTIFIGIIPVVMPVSFRVARRLTPVIRKILGKV